MSDSLIRKILGPERKKISNDSFDTFDSPELSDQARDALDTASTLMKHLKLIDELKDQMDAVDWLSKNAEELSKRPSYKTTDPAILNAIMALGASGDEVNFDLFKYAIEVVLEGFRQMTIVSYSGIKADGT